MRSERVKYWLDQPAEILNAQAQMTAENKRRYFVNNKMTLEDRMILSLIEKVILDGNHSAFKELENAAYGIMKPGDGADKKIEDGMYKATFNIPDLPEDN